MQLTVTRYRAIQCNLQRYTKLLTAWWKYYSRHPPFYCTGHSLYLQPDYIFPVVWKFLSQELLPSHSCQQLIASYFRRQVPFFNSQSLKHLVFSVTYVMIQRLTCPVAFGYINFDSTRFSKSSASEVHKKYLNLFNAAISKTVLSQTPTTGVVDKGSYAASNTLAWVMKQILKADKSLVEKAVNRLQEQHWALIQPIIL